MTLLREAIGESLRRARVAQSRTLREVSTSARVSLGYLSEVERGRKEASSELLAAICQALEVPLSQVLIDVGEAMAGADGQTARREPVAADRRVAVPAEAEPVPATDAAPATMSALASIAEDTRIVIPAPGAKRLVLVQAK
ncbi:helix-turn-helix domain-containing protein [Nocardia sp. CDC159]|uniref:Helix-turn-helix domain-containing protein n=1 Tax=Nocardia pulmonis TaxID=2951408 RepID=A0A9X2E4M9_9NOCA|nr:MULTISPECIES: helix-turn-helix transcriptional regulator [Nocardia]MCM6774149.1 helix-turn-helix domain-containing protein [Nocardia pulmonis]MCM6787036.1 helix-turn-helix domain-containing protein [Nocardia sp. CDC159]